MSDLKQLLPSIEVENHVDQETGEIMPAKFMPGVPQRYRINMSDGRMNIDGEETLTKSGEAIQILPIAVRFFQDNLFDMGTMDWVEIFFLNCKNHVCSTLLHRYSVESLLRASSKLFYENKILTEAIMTIKPMERTNKAEGSKYYIAEFSFDPADEELVQVQSDAVKGQEIYRRETLSETCNLQSALNYPVHRVEEANALLSEKAEA